LKLFGFIILKVCFYHRIFQPVWILTYFLTYLLTCLLTPCNRVLLEKLTDSQLVKKFPAFYGTRMFITAFKSARHLKFLSLHHPSVDLWGYISISVYSKYPNSARVVVLIWLLLLRLYAMSADTFVLEKLKCRTKSVQ